MQFVLFSCVGVFGDRQGVPRTLQGQRVAIVTAYFKSSQREFFGYREYENVVRYTVPNMKEYAKRHNYDFHLHGKNKLRPGRKASWVEIDLLRYYLPRYDWVYWTDVDFLFVNMDRPLPTDTKADMVVSYECLPHMQWKLMSGNLLLRSSRWSYEFLDKWDAQYQQFRDAVNHDQAAFEHLTRLRTAHIEVKHPSEFMTYDMCLRASNAAVGVHFPGPNKVSRLVRTMKRIGVGTGAAKNQERKGAI